MESIQEPHRIDVHAHYIAGLPRNSHREWSRLAYRGTNLTDPQNT